MQLRYFCWIINEIELHCYSNAAVQHASRDLKLYSAVLVYELFISTISTNSSYVSSIPQDKLFDMKIILEKMHL